MNRLIALYFTTFCLTIISCDEELRYDDIYSEALPRLELKRNSLENLNQDSFFKPGQLNQFFPSYNVFVKTSLTNSTDQIIENMTVSPKLLISYRNGFVKSFKLGKFNLKNISLKPDSNYVFKNIFRLDTLAGFKSAFFIHDVSDVKIFLNTKASNSVGFKVNLENEDLVSVDITVPWEELREFNNTKAFKSFEQVYSCYPHQLAILQTQYNERVSRDNFDIKRYLGGNGRFGYMSFYEINWTEIRYEEALNKILDKYLADLKTVNAFSPKFVSLFNQYRREYATSLHYRRKILEMVENLPNVHQIQIDSLEKLRTEKVKLSVKTFSDAMKELSKKNKVTDGISAMENFDLKFKLN